MGRSYYYFAASLPLLEFGQKPPISLDDFLGDCERLLPHGDFLFIRELLTAEAIHPEFLEQLAVESRGEMSEQTPSVKAAIEFSRKLRNHMARYRAQKASKDPKDYLRGDIYSDPGLAELIQNADKAKNPLEAELLLDRARWNFLDHLMTGHYFDLEYIIGYGVKLRILTRHEAFRSKEGPDKFSNIKKIDLSQIGARAV